MVCEKWLSFHKQIYTHLYIRILYKYTYILNEAQMNGEGKGKHSLRNEERDRERKRESVSMLRLSHNQCVYINIHPINTNAHRVPYTHNRVQTK